MAINVFVHHCYKVGLKEALRQRRRENGTTAKQLAEKIRIQYTYLSRVLNSDNHHFNEDTLFAICQALGFTQPETDFMELLRTHVTTQIPSRRKLLEKRIHNVRQRHKIRFEQQDRADSTDAYWLHPLGTVVNAALSLERFRRRPMDLLGILPLRQEELESLMEQLVKLDFISRDQNGAIINNRHNSHLPADDRRLPAHQHLLQSACMLRKIQCDPRERESIMVTVAVDTEAANAIRRRLREFIGELQEIVERSEIETDLVQINLDCFSWL